jgi:hypothetical protein
VICSSSNQGYKAFMADDEIYDDELDKPYYQQFGMSDTEQCVFRRSNQRENTGLGQIDKSLRLIQAYELKVAKKRIGKNKRLSREDRRKKRIR